MLSKIVVGKFWNRDAVPRYTTLCLFSNSVSRNRNYMKLLYPISFGRLKHVVGRFKLSQGAAAQRMVFTAPREQRKLKREADLVTELNEASR